MQSDNRLGQDLYEDEGRGHFDHDLPETRNRVSNNSCNDCYLAYEFLLKPMLRGAKTLFYTVIGKLTPKVNPLTYGRRD